MEQENKNELEFEIEEDIEDVEDNIESDIPLEKRELITASKDLPIRELKEQVSDDELKLDPSFQRYYVFNNKTASRLIESLLMNVPLPIIYLSEEEDGTNEVIDGQQRLTSFMRFLDNEFALTGLTVFKELFNIDNTCSICKQQITSLFDSVVDHKIPYSLGGKTESSNGRLAHRYCNFARGNRD